MAGRVGTMDLAPTAEQEAFRAECRSWLEEHLPWEYGRGLPPRFDDLAEEVTYLRDWQRQLADGRWVGVTWPEEYGGKGLSIIENVVLNEEFARASAPMRGDFFGDTLVGPTILQWGSEEQKREFLPKILKGQISWCQGFSEPNAGSDLASLKTTAVLDGD